MLLYKIKLQNEILTCNFFHKFITIGRKSNSRKTEYLTEITGYLVLNFSQIEMLGAHKSNELIIIQSRKYSILKIDDMSIIT